MRRVQTSQINIPHPWNSSVKEKLVSFKAPNHQAFSNGTLEQKENSSEFPSVQYTQGSYGGRKGEMRMPVQISNNKNPSGMEMNEEANPEDVNFIKEKKVKHDRLPYGRKHKVGIT